MSFRPSDEDSEPDARRIAAMTPEGHTDEAGSTPAGQTDAGNGARTPLEPDPLATLKFKPDIVNALSTIYDPEIPVNIYELGLVYDITVDANASAEVRMTLTAPGCPAAQTLPAQVQQRVSAIPGITHARVDVVWDPPWTKDRMSEAARLQLGIF
jgi:FeS assembly SUF system protein